MKIMGIDLAGKEENPTGICIWYLNKVNKVKINLFTVYSDDEILEIVNSFQPTIIVFDAPLSLPKGRCCLEKNCECAVGGHFRQSEREIRRYGPVLPLTFKGMKMLTMRGVGLAGVLSDKYQLMETHPRTVQKILGFRNLKKSLEKYFQIPQNPSEHELDGILAVLSGYFYVNDCFNELGDVNEGTIILPKGRDCLNSLDSIQ
jgi:hypothetical protein